MSAEQQKGPPETVEELVGHLEDRGIQRRLHELADEVIALAIEVTAVSADNFEVALAARDLRRHIINGGTPGSFLEEFPAHKGVDFRGLVLDEPSIEFAEAFSLLPSEPLIPIKPKELTDGMGTEQVVDIPLPEVSPESQEHIGILFERYPSVKALFSDDSVWVEEDGQDKMMPRRSIEGLLAKKDGIDMSDKHQTVVMSDLWKEWKQISPKQTGRRVKGRGIGIHLTQEEAVNFSWFIHTQTSDEGSSFRNFFICNFWDCCSRSG